MNSDFITPILLIVSFDYTFLIRRAATSDTNDSGSGKGCYYNGKYHLTSWEEGCNYICHCNNTETGYFQCHRRCPVYKNLPSDCTLELPSGEPCCKVPVCNNQTTTTTMSTPSEQQDKAAKNTTDADLASLKVVTSKHASHAVDAYKDSSTHMANENHKVFSDMKKDVSKTEMKHTKSQQLTESIDFTFDLSQFGFDNPVTTTETIVKYKSDLKDGAPGDKYTNVNVMKNMLSIEEVNPIDLHDIVFDIPTIEETVRFDISDNYSGINNMDDGKVDVNIHDSNDSHKSAYTDFKHVSKLSISKDIPPEIFPSKSRTVELQKSSLSRTVLEKPVFEHISTENNPGNNVRNETNNMTTKTLQKHTESIPNGPNPSIGSTQVINMTYTPEKHIVNIPDIVNKTVDSRGRENVNSTNDSLRKSKTVNSNAYRVTSTIAPIKATTNVINKIMRIDKSVETQGRSKTISHGWSLLRQRSRNQSSLPHPDRRCIYMGMRFKTKQTWFDGCNQICVCLDAKTGLFKCTERCPLYKTIPQGCEMKRSSVECCPLPECINSTEPEVIAVTRRPMTIADRFNKRVSGNEQSSKFIGQFSERKTKPLEPAAKMYILTQLEDGKRNTSNQKKSNSDIIVYTATGLYRLSKISRENNARHGELRPVIPKNTTSTNTTRRLSGVDKSIAPFQTVLGLCQYNGKRYRPGDTWEIGCSLLCECLPGVQGQYACKRRCKQFPVIPFGCTLQLPPNEPCCKTIQCEPTNTHTTNSVHKNQRSFNEPNPRLVTKKSIGNRQSKHKNDILSAILFKSSNSSQLSSTGISSTKSFSRQIISQRTKIEPVSNVKISHKDNSSSHLELKQSPSSDVMVSQTGAVIISKSAGRETSQIQTATTGCIVGNKVYRKGQSWKIGCKLRCFCADEVKRTMSCNRLCPKWQLPAECRLEKAPKGKCCPVPKCPDGYFIKYPHGYIPL